MTNISLFMRTLHIINLFFNEFHILRCFAISNFRWISQFALCTWSICFCNVFHNSRFFQIFGGRAVRAGPKYGGSVRPLCPCRFRHPWHTYVGHPATFFKAQKRVEDYTEGAFTKSFYSQYFPRMLHNLASKFRCCYCMSKVIIIFLENMGCTYFGLNVHFFKNFNIQEWNG